MINHLINKITKTKHNKLCIILKLCIMNYALCIAFTTCGNPDAGINYPDFFTDAIAVSAGYSHTVALKEDGTVWAWGSNEFGQLGDDTTDDRFYPVQVMSDVKAVSAGGCYPTATHTGAHTVAIKNDGTLWAWGCNDDGQLGDGTTANRTSPVQVMSDVKAVSAGDFHTVAIKGDGSVWAWGDNNYGQLGDGTSGGYESTPVKVKGEGGFGNLEGIIAVSAGGYHTVAIKEDGSVWAWGDNNRGQLGDGTSGGYKSTPVKVKGEGGFGYLEGVIAVSAGYRHTVAIDSEGKLWAWGYNYYGQLGDGTKSDSTTPNPTPIQITSMSDVKAVSAGEEHTVAIKEDGSVWAWGDNRGGQLGDGTKTAYCYPVKIGDRWAEVSAGKYLHTVAIKRDGIVWAWGDNYYGQLGDGTKTTRFVPKRVMMSGL